MLRNLEKFHAACEQQRIRLKNYQGKELIALAKFHETLLDVTGQENPQTRQDRRQALACPEGATGDEVGIGKILQETFQMEVSMEPTQEFPSIRMTGRIPLFSDLIQQKRMTRDSSIKTRFSTFSAKSAWAR